ncbi:MAG: kelch repeat-containing protein [Pyrinomonadaceae bacterium]
MPRSNARAKALVPANARPHPRLKMVKYALLLVGLALFFRLVSGPGAAQGTWTTETSLPQALQEATVTALNGKVYMIGGSQNQARSNALYAFDPATHAWTTLAPYPGAPRDHIGVAAVGNSIYIMGGITSFPSPTVNTVQKYDSISNTWTSVAPLPSPRAGMGVAAINGKIYVAGGFLTQHGQLSTSDFLVYDTANNSWQQLPQIPTARDHMAAVTLGGKFYAVGGRPGDTCAPFATIEVYDPATNAWSSLQPMTTARGGLMAGTANGRIQVFGGEGAAGNCGIIGSAEEYDPATNSWSALPSMPTPRHGTMAATIGNSVYIPGGATATGDAPTAVHERLDVATSAFIEQGGQVVIEAEHEDGLVSRGGKSWIERTNRAGFAGSGFMVAEPDTNVTINGGYTTTSPELQYQVNFTTTGIYHVWLRALPDNDTQNSIHTGIDGRVISTSDRLSTNTYGSWLWFKSTLDGPVATVNVTTPGIHTVNVWMREDGFRLDRLLLTTNSALVPTGNGPAESPRTGTTPTPTPPLPSPWVNQDIGSVGLAGSAAFSNNTFTIKGSGADIWGNADAFHYVRQPLNGDGEIIARVTSIQNTDPFAKAGLMIRESLTANSRHVILDVKPGGGLEFMRRLTNGGATNVVASSTSTAPYWLRLTRTGNTFTAYKSLNGTSWTLMGSTTIAMSANTQVGLVVTSHNNQALCTTTMDNVSVTSTPPPVVQTPFGGTPAPVPGTAQAENFDDGGEGVAYHDGGVGNNGGVHRPTENVDIEGTTDTGGGFNVGWIAATEWLEYTVNVQTAGTYTLESRVASNGVGGTFHVEFNGVDKTGAIAVPNTGGWQNWQTVTTNNVSLSAGQQVMRIAMDTNGATGAVGNLNYLKFTAAGSPGTVTCTTSANKTLGFGQSIANTYAGSGFNCFMPGSIAPDGSGLALDTTGGQLTVTTTNGDAFSTTNTQNNALALKFNNSGSYSVRARIRGPFVTSSQYQAGGVFLALDTDNYAKFALGQVGSSARLEFAIETGANFSTAVPDTGFNFTDIDSNTEALDLWLVRKSDGNLEALYRTITNLSTTPVLGPIVSAGTTTSPPAWTLSSTQLYGGLITTDSGPGGSININFDEFQFGAAVSAAIGFNNKVLVKPDTTSGSAFGIPGFMMPTSLALGPDGKLYVATLMGKIYILTLDQNALAQPGQVAVTSVQVLNDIFNRPTRTCNINNNPNNCQFVAGSPVGRQTLGLTIGPESTATNIKLYVTHSDPRFGENNTPEALAIDTRSGTITRMTLQPNGSTSDPNDYSVTANQDLVVGLPRSREAHSINGLDFGPDGWLYVSVGGHTNRGKPSVFFSGIPEYYLSATVVRLNVNGLGSTTLPMDVSNVTTAANMTPFAGKFELYATGFRNGYDLVWHSNGKLYLNDNSDNLGQGNTPNASDGCPNTPSIDTGTRPDKLLLVSQNAYGGHPNPTHGECVFYDGSVYNPPLQPEPNFLAPLLYYNDGASSNGITEYKSTAFNGQLKGNLISATYSGNQNVRRVVLNASGTAVVQEKNLGAFNKPLDVTTDANGIIYVAEFGASQITLMIPNNSVNCNDPANPDDDGDGYTDADEVANGTDPCSASSTPPDFDGDHTSDLNDPDDDNDTLADTQDQLYLDAQNGATTPNTFAFEWNPGDVLGKVANTGFTGAQIASAGPRTNTSGIFVAGAAGFLGLPTFSGTAEGAINSQVNALQIGFNSTTSFRISSRISQPFQTTAPAPGHMGGIFFGPDQDNFIRLALLGAAGGNQTLQLGLEQGGGFNTQASISLGTAPINNLDIFLVSDFNAKTIRAFYVLNGGNRLALGGAVAVPASWFSDNTGAARNTSLAGVVDSHGSATPTTFVYDFFRIDRNVTFTRPAGR